jgi:hypothetical protein
MSLLLSTTKRISVFVLSTALSILLTRQKGLAGQKHPALMGQSYKVAWAEIWEDVKDVFANARITGQATMKDDEAQWLPGGNLFLVVHYSHGW